MKKIPILFLFLANLFLITGCSVQKDDPTGSLPDQSSSEWLIPTSQILNGGPGKDGIPSIDNPRFSKADAIADLSFLTDQDLVVGVKVGDVIRAYPHPILDWHEIVNDELSGLPLAITYCPLTGTAIGWERTLNGETTTFGVSGLLYNTNLMPYDRATNSTWSQMLLKGVNGPHIRKEINTYPVVETSWKEWKNMFPNAEVLNLQTGFNRAYGQYPYGDYKTNHDFLLFPISNNDNRLPKKERGLGVSVDGQSRFYRFRDFSSAEVVSYHDNLNGKAIVVAGSSSRNFMVAYNREIKEGVILDFFPVIGNGQVILQDQDGHQWSIFGEALNGPYAGQRLKPLDAYIGMWFAWAAFHPEIELFHP